MPTSSKTKHEPSGFLNVFAEKLFTPRIQPGQTGDELYTGEMEYFPDGSIIVGPVLHFRGIQDKRYHLAIIVLAIGTTPPILNLQKRALKRRPISLLSKKTPSGHDTTLWRFDVQIRQRRTDRIYEYEVKSPYVHLQTGTDIGGESAYDESDQEEEDVEEPELVEEVKDDSDVISETADQESIYNRKFKFIVPGTETPPYIGALSCNGQKKDKIFTELWERLHKTHLNKGMHLLLHGGDQIYSDPYIWKCHKSLNNFLNKFRKHKTPFTDDIRNALDDHYFATYVRYWTLPPVAKVLSEIPNIMMWDDHDIIDGFGSYRTSWQRTPVFQGIFSVAKKYFMGFQLGMNEGETLLSSLRGSPGLTQVFNVNGVAILSLDNRGERTRRQIMSEETHHALQQYLTSLQNIYHVIAIIGVPIVYNSFHIFEKVITNLNFDLEDDIRDHWRSWRHHRERKRFVKMLQQFSREKRWRTTFVAGDVHVACAAVLHNKHESGNACVLNVLVTSGMGSAPPPPALLKYLNFTSRMKDRISKTERIRGGLHLFDDGTTYLNSKRNFLLLLFDHTQGLRCEWHAEATERVWKLYIHPWSEVKSLDYSFAKLKKDKENDVIYEEKTQIVA